MQGRWLLAACFLFNSCVPWTVRPIDESGQKSGGPFDAARYVDSIWQSKVLPAAAQARDLSVPCSSPCLVKGQGKVLSVDEASRDAFIVIDAGARRVQIHIGPVIGGTVLRDALPFIQFSQFTNQLDYARVANALNDRVLHTVLADVRPKTLPGAEVTFSGAAAGTAPDVPPVIVPVTLSFRRGNL